MSSNWLVTGSQGFIGRYVVAHILNTRPEARVLGIGRSTLLTQHVSHRYQYRAADLNDSRMLREIVLQFEPDYVIHLAASLRGDDRTQLLRTNVEGTGHLVDCVADIGCSSLVLGSSGGVYGLVDPSSLPLSETEACRPADEYSMSKLAAEHLARVLLLKSRVRLPIARIFNAIGPGQDQRHVGGRIASEFAAAINGHQDRVRLGPLYPTRDFIDVRDIATALAILAEAPTATGPFNVASGEELSIQQLVETFCSVAGMRPKIESESGYRVAVPRHCANINRLGDLGFRRSFTIQKSVESLLAHSMLSGANSSF